MAKAPLSNKFTVDKDGAPAFISAPVVAAIGDPLLIGVKTQSNAALIVGQVQEYTCTITAVLAQAAGLVFSDKLDPRVQYVANSFKVNGVLAVPTVNAGTNTLTFILPAMVPAVAITLTFQVLLTTDT